MKKMARILSMVLALCMMASIVTIPAIAEEDYREPIELTVFSELANFAGEQTGWYAKELKDRFNVTLKFVSSNLDPNAYAAGVSAGELGDIINLGDMGEHFVESLKAGLLYDLSELDMTPYTNLAGTLESQAKVTEFAKGATELDGVWGFTFDIGHEKDGWSDLTNPSYALQVRYDAWAKAGMPEVATLEDLPAFLKALQDAVPENEGGEKVYAYGGFSDWEDCVMKFTWDLMTFYGYQEFDFMGVNYATGDIVNPLEDGSLYYRALKVNNELYRQGLFDPESVSQNFDTYSQKLAGGRYLMALWGWIINQYNTNDRAEAEVGFTTFLVGDAKPVMQTISTAGGNRLWALGADCEYPERAMEIINWIASEEGIIVGEYGPQGLTWDYDENGVPYMLDFGWSCYEERKETEMPAENGGGTFEDGMNAFNNTIYKLHQNALGKEYSYHVEGWASYAERYDSNLSKAWQANYANGAANGVELYRETEQVSIAPSASITYAKAALSDDGNAKRAMFAPVMKQFSWQCVMAETEEQFEALWNEMVTTCKSYGYDDVAAEKLVDIQNCLDFIEANK
ncbi:MAG: extracellular solute-binding protein [Clostridiales bacterium]|nr:extracellular solute-binding protein [Clostridiales bacterium]